MNRNLNLEQNFKDQIKRINNYVIESLRLFQNTEIKHGIDKR